jgi:hypothetical protein
MMTPEMILALLRDRATELNQRADAKVASLGVVNEAEETTEQRKIRASAQGDWQASQELLAVMAKIET